MRPPRRNSHGSGINRIRPPADLQSGLRRRRCFRRSPVDPPPLEKRTPASPRDQPVKIRESSGPHGARDRAGWGFRHLWHTENSTFCMLRTARWLAFASSAVVVVGIAPSQILLALALIALLLSGEELR